MFRRRAGEGQEFNMPSRVWKSEVGRPLPPGHGAISLMHFRKRRRRVPVFRIVLALAILGGLGAMTVAPGTGLFLGLG